MRHVVFGIRVFSAVNALIAAIMAINSGYAEAAYLMASAAWSNQIATLAEGAA